MGSETLYFLKELEHLMHLKNKSKLPGNNMMCIVSEQQPNLSKCFLTFGKKRCFFKWVFLKIFLTMYRILFIMHCLICLFLTSGRSFWSTHASADSFRNGNWETGPVTWHKMPVSKKSKRMILISKYICWAGNQPKSIQSRALHEAAAMQ